MNARYTLNAANARWMSLYDSLYGTDVIEQSEDSVSERYDPLRGEMVIKYGRDFLIFVPLASNAVKIKNFIDTNYKKGLYKYKPYTIVFTKNTVGLENEIATGKNGLEKIEESNDYQFKIIIATPKLPVSSNK